MSDLQRGVSYMADVIIKLQTENLRLAAELAEARDRQDRWYETEARLHGILCEVCGDDKYGEAIGRLCDPTLAEHNPIIAERDALRAQVEGLREALERYGSHDPDCRYVAGFNASCTCGFRTALAGAKP